MSSSGPLEQLTSQSGAYEIISKALADKNAAESALLDTDKDLENSRHRTQFFIDKVKEKDDIIDDRELEILRMYFVLDGLAKDWWVLQAPLSKLPSEHQRSTLRFSSLGQTRRLNSTCTLRTLTTEHVPANKRDAEKAINARLAIATRQRSLQNTITVLTEALRKEQATHERTQRAYLNVRAKLEFLADGWVPIDNTAAQIVISMDEVLSDAQEFCARTKDHADAMLEDLQKKGIHA
ncbi:uncharacterized protein SCHCODRAFT_02664927 [Schizophyllum commune H4-8]|uniref:uncharacterized protein n=1 Tax=Schizophyllum commune (strain H4-8 / FGSC 9210) TaxID=578458 RepID=UPI00215ED18A|nr:uncharacterized protein SCHCODRAFT_02664927 [Schizophyllum commune H4-8]KAI5897206.1 hypothetical protein SCHCODRAFT_02664927 [Schizophyllum commune H4-8]